MHAMPNGAHERDRAQEVEQRVAAAEINGRRVNEAIERGRAVGDTAVFICECGVLGCNTTIGMRISDYEAVRTDFDRFFVAPGHEIGGIDEVVERHPMYLVVTKQGRAADAARVTNPRNEEHGSDDTGQD
jgi:hypothetical protein